MYKNYRGNIANEINMLGNKHVGVYNLRLGWSEEVKPVLFVVRRYV